MEQKQIIVALTIIILLITGKSWSQNSGLQSVNEQKKNKMETLTISTIEKNKEVVRMLTGQVLNKKRTELLKDLIAEDYIGFRGAKGPAGFLEPIKPLWTAFPDIEWNIEDMVAEGDKVMVRWKWQGTHQAQFTNFPATGKTFNNDGMAVYALKNGKVTATIALTDRLGFLQQMGAIPEDVTKLSVRKTYKDRVQFIDKFFVPAAARTLFYERMRINREFIKKLPGFLEDAAYEYLDETGNLTCITVAQWASLDAVNKAKEAVQAEYKKQGFDPSAMFRQMNITLERYLCKEVQE